MKQLITMAACLMVLMALLSQFVQNQKLLMQMEAGSHAVDAFCETRDVGALKEAMGRIFDCQPEGLVITEEENCYVIKAPVKPILANPSFWGVEPEENQGMYRWERNLRDE